MNTPVHRPLLEVRDLRVIISTRHGEGRAVDGVSFDVGRQEALGLVGESGSGKSMLCLALMGANPRPASRIAGGEILFDGHDLVGKSRKEYRAYRGKALAMVLQDPGTALNPSTTIREQIFESLREHRGLSREDLRSEAVALLQKLEIVDAQSRLDSYPHQLSGGMRQRVVGAIALASDPALLIADEPTTSLDVTVQAKYLKLLRHIRKTQGLSLIFVSHDIAVVGAIADRVAVMYAGKLVEIGPRDVMLDQPLHPYTEALLASVPDLTERPERLPEIEGDPPTIYELGPGCPFAPRCSYVEDRCWSEFPPVHQAGSGHVVHCWKYEP